MDTEFGWRRDGDDLLVRLGPAQAAALREALAYACRDDAGPAYLTVLLGADRDLVDGIARRLDGSGDRPVEVRLRPAELHTALSALTQAATHFVSPAGLFSQEAFLIRLGFYRENFDALARAFADAAFQAYGNAAREVSE